MMNSKIFEKLEPCDCRHCLDNVEGRCAHGLFRECLVSHCLMNLDGRCCLPKCWKEDKSYKMPHKEASEYMVQIKELLKLENGEAEEFHQSMKQRNQQLNDAWKRNNKLKKQIKP